VLVYAEKGIRIKMLGKQACGMIQKNIEAEEVEELTSNSKVW
jgi:hypothetical protein